MFDHQSPLVETEGGVPYNQELADADQTQTEGIE
jgi:hypothetical protein